MIGSQVTYVQYPGNGVTTQFAFDNKVFEASDLLCTLINLATGATTPAGAFTVTNVDVDTGCSVVMASPPPAGYNLDIRTNTPELQQSSIKNQGAYYPELIEESLDSIVRQMQDLTRKTLTFGIHGPDNESIPWPALPAPPQRVGLGLGFDGTGQLSLITLLAQALTQSVFNTFLLQSPPLAPTAAETAAGAVVVNGQYPPGCILRYGTNVVPGLAAGATDMSTALNAAIAQAGNGGADVFIPAGQYYISQSGSGPFSYIQIYLAPAAVLSVGANGISHFSFINQTRIKICGKGRLTATAPSNVPHIAGAFWQDCTYCDVDDLLMNGLAYDGVHGIGSSFCKVRNCAMSNFVGTVSDQAGVGFLSDNANDALGNEVSGCVFFATGFHGVLIQDPYVIGHVPRKNKVHHNHCSGGMTDYAYACYIPSNYGTGTGGISGTAMTLSAINTGNVLAGYVVVDANTGVRYGNISTGAGLSWTLDASATVSPGTALYFVLPQDSYNQFYDNYAEGVLGGGSTAAPNTSSGNGIYVVGQGAGATSIRGNTIVDCCKLTSAASQAPAGIGVAGVIGNSANPVTGGIIDGNNVLLMSQGHGIQVSGCAGVAIGDNQVLLPASNVGTGPGGSALLGAALSIVNSSGTVFTGGRYETLGAGSAIFVQANGQNQDDVVGSGFRAKSVNAATVRWDQLGGFLNRNCMCDGKATNTGTGSTNYALQINSCPGFRGRGEYLTAGSVGIVCGAGSFADGRLEIEYGGGTGGLVSNSCIGMQIIARGSAAPSAGTHQIGDRIDSDTGANLAWVCSVTGTPGTWVSH